MRDFICYSFAGASPYRAAMEKITMRPAKPVFSLVDATAVCSSLPKKIDFVPPIHARIQNPKGGEPSR